MSELDKVIDQIECHALAHEQKLRAEIERLRAALEEIAEFPYVGTQASQRIRTIIHAALDRRALEGK